MKAIETTGRIDKEGRLHLDNPIAIQEKKVKVIILVAEEDEPEDKLWLKATTGNRAFNFLNDPAEDIYSITDGKPFHD